MDRLPPIGKMQAYFLEDELHIKIMTVCRPRAGATIVMARDARIKVASMLEWLDGRVFKPNTVTKQSWTKERKCMYQARNIEMFLRYTFPEINQMFIGECKTAIMAELAEDYDIDRTEIGRIIKRVRKEGTWKK